MKLLNPTDQELDAALAVHVAGWTQWTGARGVPLGSWHDGKKDRGKACFTRSMDAVLPWLEKCDSWNMEYDQGEIEETIVNVWSPKHGQYKGDGSLPRAAVIALLRAHGVEVEFTQ